MPNLNPGLQSYIINKVALQGINSFDDPKDIADQECTDVLNMVYDNGYVEPRQGSLLYAEKPTGETAQPFQFLVPRTSDGIDSMITVYGNNFYLWDQSHLEWIKLNQIYTPSRTGLYYGSTNWNNGIIDDRFYFGNGYDDTMKWIQAVNSLAFGALAASTTLTLNDATRFPNQIEVGQPTISLANPAIITFPQPHGLVAGDIVIFQPIGASVLPASIVAGTQYFVLATGLTTTHFEISTTVGGTPVDTSADTESGFFDLFTTTVPIILKQPGGSAINLKYTNNASNVLTLKTTVGQIVPANATVTIPIIDKNNIPKGSVFAKFQNRLIIANSSIAQNTLNWSYLNDAENFIDDGTVASAGFYVIYKGKGGIINLDDFGQYLCVEKNDIMLQFQFIYASDNSNFIVQLIPIMSGEDIGPVSNANSINYMNTLYYTTLESGIIAFTPVTTGSQISASLNVLSEKIQNYVTDVLNFSNGRATGFSQKLFWAVSVPVLNGIVNTVNNGIIVYDLIRNAWARYDNWNAADIKPVNGDLYYLSLNDGAVYQCFVDYQDAVDDTPFEYDVSFTTKRFDMGNPQLLSRDVYVYIQGYINETSKFYVDVLFNENGYLGKQTFLIDGSNSTIVNNNILGGLGAFPFAIPLLGGFNLATMQHAQQPAFYRAYLEVSQAFRANNIQIKCYSQDIGSYWAVNNLTIMSLPEPSIPTQLVLSPTMNPPVVI